MLRIVDGTGENEPGGSEQKVPVVSSVDRQLLFFPVRMAAGNCKNLICETEAPVSRKSSLPAQFYCYDDVYTGIVRSAIRGFSVAMNYHCRVRSVSRTIVAIKRWPSAVG